MCAVVVTVNRPKRMEETTTHDDCVMPAAVCIRLPVHPAALYVDRRSDNSAKWSHDADSHNRDVFFISKLVIYISHSH